MQKFRFDFTVKNELAANNGGENSYVTQAKNDETETLDAK